MSAQQNTRQHPRFDIRISAEVTTSDHTFTCVTRNLSAGGVGLACDRQLFPQTPVRVTLFVVVDDIEDLGTDPLMLEAVVVWCRPSQQEQFETGLQFKPMTQQQGAYLGRFLAAVSPRQD